eukprot:m.1032702 g.1032702  ORF g.1032702 m.1032702 type:complete len:285 (-) comp24124_c0_seq3:2768-3622(-)
MAESLLDTTYSLFKTLEDNNSGYARWVRCSATLRTCASDIVTEADIASKFESIALESVSEGHKNLVTFDQFLNAHLFLTGVKIEGSTVFDHLQQTSQIVEECSSLKDELLEMAEKEVQLQKDLVFAKEENQRLQDDLYTRQKDFQNVLQLAHQREDEGVRSIGDESMFDIGNSILDDTLLNDMMHRDRERRAADGNASVNSTDMSPFKLALATSLGTRRQPSNADMMYIPRIIPGWTSVALSLRCTCMALFYRGSVASSASCIVMAMFCMVTPWSVYVLQLQPE